MFISIKRTIKSGWHNLSHDGGLFFANIFIMTMVISLITGLFLFQETTKFLISNLEEKVDIAIYFKENSTEEEILSYKDEIEDISEVQKVLYISKKDALDKFTDRHADSPVLMESLLEVGINPFLASLNVQAKEPSQYEAVAAYLDTANFKNSIEKIDYNQRKPVIERIFAFSANLGLIGIVFSIILAVVAILVAFNSVRLAIYNSREEIKIQRLVGASNWFIRGPFIIQGIIAGAIAAFITLAVYYLALWLLNAKIGMIFPSLNMFQLFSTNLALLLLIQFGSGIGLGVTSSLIAIRRYLEV